MLLILADGRRPDFNRFPCVRCILCDGRKGHEARRVKKATPRPLTLPAGKLHLCLCVGGNPVATRGTITPEPNRVEDIAVLARPGTLQDQRTMHAAVGSNNEADADLRMR